MRGDLVSLTTTKSWLGITGAQDDQLLSTLITQISRAVYNVINRDIILPRTQTDYFNGNCKQQIHLRDWPVNTVNWVVVDSTTIPPGGLPSPGVPAANGWVLEPGDVAPPGNMQRVYLQGYYFNKGSLNVGVNYDVGYKITDDPYTIPATSTGSYEINVSHPYGTWGCDVGVKYASSKLPLTATTSETPAVGQYCSTDFGQYVFNASDAGLGVLISYGYIPASLEQTALMWIADQYRQKDRIGMQSKSLGGQETMSYIVKSMPDFVKDSLRNFTRIVVN